MKKYRVIDKNGQSCDVDSEAQAWQILQDSLVSLAQQISPRVYNQVTQNSEGMITISNQPGLLPEQCFNLELIKELIRKKQESNS